MSEIKPKAGFWLRQMVRGGPFVPIRVWWCDHAPYEPDNKLDRGNVPFLAAEVAGVWYDPPNSTWNEPAFELAVELQFTPQGHWRAPQPISERVYNLEVAQIRRSRERGLPDPRLNPYRAIKMAQLSLPSFDGDHPR